MIPGSYANQTAHRSALEPGVLTFSSGAEPLDPTEMSLMASQVFF